MKKGRADSTAPSSRKFVEWVGAPVALPYWAGQLILEASLVVRYGA